jgi:hypothetical protein
VKSTSITTSMQIFELFAFIFQKPRFQTRLPCKLLFVKGKNKFP